MRRFGDVLSSSSRKHHTPAVIFFLPESLHTAATPCCRGAMRRGNAVCALVVLNGGRSSTRSCRGQGGPGA